MDESLKSVWIHAYRGKHDDRLFVDRCRGRSLPPPTLLDCLIYAGHVGISFDQEANIFGFLPSASYFSPNQLLDELQEGAQLPGEVDDHTSLFAEAALRGCRVLKVEYRYQESRQARIRAEVEVQRVRCDLTYSFPGGEGDCNCATWLARIGMTLPESTGQMRLFVQILGELVAISPLVID